MRQAPRIVGDEARRHLHDQRRTTSALLEGNAPSPRMRRLEGPDAFRVCPLEAVDALIIIAQDRQRPVCTQLLNEVLLRSVQVLELINHHVLEGASLDGQRVVAEVAQGNRHELAHQHGFVPAERLQQSVLEALVRAIDRSPRPITLATRPGSLESAGEFAALGERAERIGLEVPQEDIALELSEQARPSLRDLENTRARQHREAVAMECSCDDVAPFGLELAQAANQIPYCSSSERDDQNLARRAPLLNKARDAAD